MNNLNKRTSEADETRLVFFIPYLYFLIYSFTIFYFLLWSRIFLRYNSRFSCTQGFKSMSCHYRDVNSSNSLMDGSIQMSFFAFVLLWDTDEATRNKCGCILPKDLPSLFWGAFLLPVRVYVCPFTMYTTDCSLW